MPLSLSLFSFSGILCDKHHRLREFAIANGEETRKYPLIPVYPVTHLQRRGTLGNHSCGLLQRLRGLLLPDGGDDLKGRKKEIKGHNSRHVGIETIKGIQVQGDHSRSS